MKDCNWKIKISDFLSNPGKIEKINFINKYMNGFNIIGDKGIYGNITIRGLNNSEILVNISELKTNIKYSCDICFDNFNYKIEIINKEIIFMLEENRKSIGKIHDKEFIINQKDETINLEEIIYQLLTISEPIVKDCGNHKKNIKNNIEDNISNSGGTIMWK